MKIFQEVTSWADVAVPPNHVYLMDGDKAYAYVPWGKGKPQYFKNFIRLDRRGRKFVEVKQDTWGFKFDAEPQGRSWTVKGSKGDEYHVTENSGDFQCTCTGFRFRGACKHIESIRQAV